MKRSTSILLAAGAGAAGLFGLAASAFVTARKVESLAPAMGKVADVGGQEIHYVDRGQGPALLLIHGLGGNLRNFTYALVDLLAERFRVVAIDRPGSGFSPRAKGASPGLSHQADVVAGLIKKIGLERPLIVGHSLGGALALAIALRHPGIARGLALVSPLTQPTEDVPAAFAGLKVPNALVRAFIGWTFAMPVTIARRATIFGELFGPERMPDDFPTRGGGLLGLRPEAFFATSSELMAVPEDLPGHHARYGALDMPVGVLFGAGDRILGAKMHGRSLAEQVKGATFEEIAGGGHMIPVTRPREVADFIARVDARTGAEAAAGAKEGAR